MKRLTTFSIAALAALVCLCAAGCASHNDVQAPAGMQVGPPLTQAQLQAAYQAKAAHRGQQTAPGQ